MSFLIPRTKVELFKASGLWTKPKGARHHKVMIMGGGASGGGQVVAATPVAGGGGVGSYGGGAGGFCEFEFPSDMLQPTENIIVGLGGASIAPSAVNSVAGVAGNPGGNSSFGPYLVARGGLGAAVSGRSIQSNTNSGTTGNTNQSNSGNTLTSNNNPSLFIGSGGGAAQTLAASVFSALGVGSDGNPIQVTTPTVGGNLVPGVFTPIPGALGAGRPGNATRNGNPGASFGVSAIMGGAGGGAGFSDAAANGGNGGDGGFPGGGGGAAGMAVNPSSSGTSGKGGDGYVLVITYF